MKIAVAFTYVVFIQAVSGQQQDQRPRIKTSNSTLLVDAGSTWHLQCEGSRPVNWIIPDAKEMKSNTSRVVIAEHYDNSADDDMYESTLNVTASVYTDTGRYTCYYDSSISANGTASVYVYVKDEKHLLLPVLGDVLIIENDPEAVLPCKPTHPRVNVTLIERSDPKAKQVRFDPQRGWLIPNPSKDEYYDKKFTCVATLGSLASNEIFYTNWKADTSTVEPPTVYMEKGTNPLLTGQSFQLKCFVSLHHTFSFDLEWIYPKTTAEWRAWRQEYYVSKLEESWRCLFESGVCRLNEASTKNSSKDKVERKNCTTACYSKVLYVYNTSADDSGNYSCQVTLVHNSHKIHSSIVVQVSPRTKPALVNTTLLGDTTKTLQGKDVEMVCIFSGAPLPTITWYKAGELISPETPGVTIKDDSSKLTIMRVTEDNNGDYSCKALNTEGFVFLNTTLHVITPASKQAANQEGGHVSSLITLGVASAVIFIIFSVLLFNFVSKERKQRRNLAVLQRMLFEQDDIVSLDPEVPLSDQVELLPYDRKWEVPRNKIKLGRPLGQGAFGRVLKAQVYGLLDDKEEPLTVAVKLTKERAELSHHKALLQELKIMIHLGRHPNILNLLGACTTNLRQGGVLAIVEYCSQGSLRHFLLQHRDVFINEVDPKTGNIVLNTRFMCMSDEDSSGLTYQNVSGCNGKFFPAQSTMSDQTIDTAMTNLSQEEVQLQTSNGSYDAVFTTDGNRRYSRYQDGRLTTCDILCIAFQVARGMEYLASKRMVHRDLAARNILLTEDNIVKICDFGLAKDLYNETIYKKKGKQGPLPVKWMALESIRDRTFSSQSDVWSFGIVLWEAFTLGGTPYPGIEIDGEFFQKLVNGYRLGKPDFASSNIYEVMRDCWKAEAKERPTFTELVERIGKQLDENIKKYYVNLDFVNPNSEAAIAAGYVTTDVCKADGIEDDDNAKAETPFKTGYLNLPQSHSQSNEYLIMDSPTDKCNESTLKETTNL